MKNSFTDSVIQVLTKTTQRSLIVKQEEIKGVSDKYIDATPITCNLNTEGASSMAYVNLTTTGIDHFLGIRGYNTTEAEAIKDKVLDRETNQVTSLVSYLTLENKLKGGIVPVTLRDGRVGTDQEMFRDTYCIPLNVLFNTITLRGFSPVRVDTIKTMPRIPKQEYTKYLYLNRNITNMVTVFIDVSKGQ